MYDVWDEDVERKDLQELLQESHYAARKANGSSASKGKNASRLGSNDGSVTDEKNALIEEMKKRIEGQTNLSAQELLATAGVSNQRLNQALDPNIRNVDFMSLTNKQNSREEALAVAMILKSVKLQREHKHNPIEKEGKSQKMVGKTRYDLPTIEYYKHQIELKKNE